jgi:hypothetical protein
MEAGKLVKLTLTILFFTFIVVVGGLVRAVKFVLIKIFSPLKWLRYKFYIMKHSVKKRSESENGLL